MTATGSRWRRLRELLAHGLSPREVGFACALGAGCGVVPLPGLQMLICGVVAWRLRLNLPIALAVSNISFGPLLAVWLAVETAIGRCLRSGDPPWTTYAALVAEFRAAGTQLREILHVAARSLVDLMIGGLLVTAVVSALAGVIGWLVARRVQARRDALAAVGGGEA